MTIASYTSLLFDHLPKAAMPTFAQEAIKMAAVVSIAEIFSIQQAGVLYDLFDRLSCYAPVALTASLTYAAFKNYSWSPMIASTLLVIPLAAKTINSYALSFHEAAQTEYHRLDNEIAQTRNQSQEERRTLVEQQKVAGNTMYWTHLIAGTAKNISQAVFMTSRFALVALAGYYAKVDLDAAGKGNVHLATLLSSTLTAALTLHIALEKRNFFV